MVGNRQADQQAAMCYKWYSDQDNEVARQTYLGHPDNALSTYRRARLQEERGYGCYALPIKKQEERD